MAKSRRHAQQPKTSKQSKQSGSQVRDLVFRRGPVRLRQFVEAELSEMDLQEDGAETPEEEFEDYPECEDPDDDAPPESPEGDANPSLFHADDAEEDLGGHHVLQVFFEDSKGCVSPQFGVEEVYASINSRQSVFVRMLHEFLAGIAEWFASCAQEFLAEPCLENLMKAETDEGFSRYPIVTQEGFLSLINGRASTKLREYQAGSIFKHTLLVWEDGTTWPLEQLFSREARVQSVVEGCRRYFPKPGVWTTLSAADVPLLSRGLLDESETKFDRLDPIELLKHLRSVTDLRSSDDINQVLVTLTSVCKPTETSIGEELN